MAEAEDITASAVQQRPDVGNHDNGTSHPDIKRKGSTRSGLRQSCSTSSLSKQVSTRSDTAMPAGVSLGAPCGSDESLGQSENAAAHIPEQVGEAGEKETMSVDGAAQTADGVKTISSPEQENRSDTGSSEAKNVAYPAWSLMTLIEGSNGVRTFRFQINAPAGDYPDFRAQSHHSFLHCAR
jgi:hypothetical protein